MKPVGTMTWVFSDGHRRVTAAYSQFNVLGHAEIFEIPIPQACGGQAECGTCRVRILSGQMTPAFGEEQELRQNHRTVFADDERLGCRARPLGDVVVVLRAGMSSDFRD